MLVLLPPVPGPVLVPFAYARRTPFVRGQHRGVDIAAPAGTAVRAPCSGTVAWAAPRGVTLRCDGFRVTLLPETRGTFAAVDARAGGTVVAGQPVARGRGGVPLHLGVRRAGDPFAYVDPVPLLRAAPPPGPTLLPGPRGRPLPTGPPRAAPRVVVPRPVVPRPVVPRPVMAPRAVVPRPVVPGLAVVADVARTGPAVVAPTLAWVGVAGALVALAGGGQLHRRRRDGARDLVVARPD